MRQFLARVGAAVRTAIGKPILPELAIRAHTAHHEAEKAREQAAASKMPQPMRLWLLARSRRQCSKRRWRDSAKSPAANRRYGAPRLGRCTNPLSSYDEFKREQAAERAAKRVAQ